MTNNILNRTNISSVEKIGSYKFGNLNSNLFLDVMTIFKDFGENDFRANMFFSTDLDNYFLTENSGLDLGRIGSIDWTCNEFKTSTIFGSATGFYSSATASLKLAGVTNVEADLYYRTCSDQNYYILKIKGSEKDLMGNYKKRFILYVTSSNKTNITHLIGSNSLIITETSKFL